MTPPVLNFPTPIEQIAVDGQPFYLKRDDVSHPDFSGNKARKLYYYLCHDFPNTTKIVSYGSAQSNAMYSLSVLARMRGWVFEYFVDHIAEYLKENPHGNYAKALENGMAMRVKHGEGRPKVEGKSVVTPTKAGIHDDTTMEPRAKYEDDKKNSVLYIEEGGRQKEAEFGIELLAKEIRDWQKAQHIEKLNIFLPSGTGTTALYLQKHLLPTVHAELVEESHFPLLPSSFQATVYTVPCVGDASYLRKQFFQLESDEAMHPAIIEPDRKYHFGKLYSDHYKIWLKLRQQTGIEFDLLYDPQGWIALLAHPEIFARPTLYLHQGGLIGNDSMLPRYQRKYKI